LHPGTTVDGAHGFGVIEKARQVGVRHMVVFVNKVDVADLELLDMVEMEVSEQLAKFDYAPIFVRGSALEALRAIERGDAASPWVQAIVDLVAAMDRHIPVPDRDLDGPFRMPIEAVQDDRRGRRDDRAVTTTRAPGETLGARDLPGGCDRSLPARDRAQLERLCRYVARPAIASERLELLPDGWPGSPPLQANLAGRVGGRRVRPDRLRRQARRVGPATALDFGTLSRMSGTPREHPRVRGQGRSWTAAEQDGGGSDGCGESRDAGWVIRGDQLRAPAGARTSLARVHAHAASFLDRRAALRQLRRSDEAHRGDHRQARRSWADARARRLSERCPRAVASPRASPRRPSGPRHWAPRARREIGL